MTCKPKKILSMLALVCILTLNACSLQLLEIPGGSNERTPTEPAGPAATATPGAVITFNVTLPIPLLPDEFLYLSVVDEVTGLGLNAINHIMNGMDALHYTVSLPFPIGSVVTYRYLRQSTLPILEDDYSEMAVRYRMVLVSAPGSVEDIISSWSDGLFAAPMGRITGKVTDQSDGNPVTNILIAVGGQQTLTDSTGAFHLEGLPPGTHTLVAFAPDGLYHTFQQGAMVQENKTTPALITMEPATLVNVRFTVSLPENTVPNVPIRLAGNLYTLGNTFGDLGGGLSTVASRMPTLAPLGDGRYSISLLLPEGADVRYKYTLGDGFWNAEHGSDGTFTLRQLIVPAGEEFIDVIDLVSSWQAGSSSPILFEVTVPEETPATDIISIQFNPYGWTVPIPMWAMGGNQWTYQLYSPLNILGTFEYRYCRNDQCGLADDTLTSMGKAGRRVSSSLLPQDLQDSVSDWLWLESLPSTTLVGLPVTPRTPGFWTGIEFLSQGDPTWSYWLPQAILNVQALYANWLVLTPEWTVSRTTPFVLTTVPGSDDLFADTSRLAAGAHALNLNTAVFPAVDLPAEIDAWWLSAPHDLSWWNAWFEQYRAFAVHHADLATRTGSQALILGGEWVLPALPGGQIGSGGSSVPADAEARWRAILTEVRSHFSGSILWAMAYPGDLEFTPAFVRDLDGIYLLWNASLSTSASPGVEEMTEAAGALLDSEIQPFQAVLGKPVIIGAAYPSAVGAAGGGIPTEMVFIPGSTLAPVDLQIQADLYQALFAAVNTRPWVSGFVSRGFYPPAVLHDASASVHGKPAADILWYWYPRFLGIAP